MAEEKNIAYEEKEQKDKKKFENRSNTNQPIESEANRQN